MRRILQLIKFIAVACCMPVFAYAQSAPADTVSNGSVREQLIANYHAGIGLQAGLYNGSLYEPNSPLIKGNPYYLNLDFVKGSVIYDGVLYADVPLKYDMFKDQFVSLLYNNFSNYSLITDRVQLAVIDGHRFVTLPGTPNMEGYFDELYNGSSRLLVKRKMVIQASVGTFESGKYYQYKTNYYVYANGKYNSVSDLGDITSLFKTRKKEINNYLKQNKIKFKNNRDQAMISALSYYDSINPPR